jgi:hypothetical protein
MAFFISMLVNLSVRADESRANCSEKQTSMDELDQIAKKSLNMLDFLKSIPKDTLPSFTFITNSLSLHRGVKDASGEGQVSPMWPRAIRSSFDGKITISFVCDPKNITYGKVEIIHFDDNQKVLKTTEYDFGNSKNAVLPSDRIHKDPISCTSCHGGSEVNGKATLKYNWPEYSNWSDCKENRGIQIYGGLDDTMGVGTYLGSYYRDGCNYELSAAQLSREKINFQKFREMQKNNSCFNTLPWENGNFETPENKAVYPYVNELTLANAQNLSVRSNLRFTTAYAKITSEKMAKMFKESKDYEKIKYFLVMDQSRCLKEEDIKDLKELFPEIHYQASNNWVQKLMKDYGATFGLQDTDWSMEFKKDATANYNIGYGSLGLLVSSVILEDIGETNKNIKKIIPEMLRGDDYSNSKFACLMNSFKTFNRSEYMCGVLREENKKNIERLQLASRCKETAVSSLITPLKQLDNSVQVVVRKLNEDKIAEGKKLVEADGKGKCVTCHSSSVDRLPKDFRFIPSDKDPKKQDSLNLLQTRSLELSQKIEYRLIKTKTMPPIENSLTDTDRESIQAYLLSLMSQGK